MSKRGKSDNSDSINPDLTPMIDVCFQLITFFVMLMTLTKDEQARKIQLPDLDNTAHLNKEQDPNSINLNIDDQGNILSWGLTLSLNDAGQVKIFRKQLQLEKSLTLRSQGKPTSSPTVDTTVILRAGFDTDYGYFLKAQNVCRSLGYTKFQLKVNDKDPDR